MVLRLLFPYYNFTQPLLPDFQLFIVIGTVMSTFNQMECYRDSRVLETRGERGRGFDGHLRILTTMHQPHENALLFHPP